MMLEYAPILAGLTSLALAVTALARQQRTRLHWSFAAGMLGFAVESAAAAVLLTRADTPDQRLFWLQTLKITGLALLFPWGLFVAALPYAGLRTLSRRSGLALVVAGFAIAATMAAVPFLPTFEVSGVSGPFYAAAVEPAARVIVFVELLATVALLVCLEAALRSSRGDARWATKFLVLGLGSAFLARFYFLSQVALFNVMLASYVTASAATLIVGNVVIAVSLARDRLNVPLEVSRQVVYRSVVVGVLGVYLMAVGVLGWVASWLGIAEELVWGSVVVFVSAIGLAAVMLSEAVRWRIKQFVAQHFYRSKYDYRVQWGNFTKRLGSLVSQDELAHEVLSAAVESVGATQGVLYLADPHDGRHHPATVVGIDLPAQPLDGASPLITALEGAGSPHIVDDPSSLSGAGGTSIGVSAGWVVVALRWRSELAGVMAIGPERTGESYGPEDLEFLATVAEQAAGAIVTARLSETVARAREFEAFHRLTSFVVHDLKNSIHALSLLSQNALQNFDDPEFQRDAVKTLARTVDRMKGLMARLSAAPDAAHLRVQPVDLAALVLEAALPVTQDSRISVVKELHPLPPIPGDPDVLLRVVQNLVTNAVQAIRGEGVVTLRTYSQAGNAVFSVSDTGAGMSEEFIRKSLFAPFRSTKKGGWGIGLYQAKTMIEAHGGTIEVESVEGAGTTFTVTLPAVVGGSA